MKNIDLILKWVVLIGVVVVSLSIAYYALWFLPAKERTEQERYRQAHVENCLKKLEEENTPVMQKLVEGLMASSNTPNSKTMATALETFTSEWNGQKADCHSLK